ncbi:GntR family transcriptional regulator [Yoonia sp. SS1-5]|uniref:GntR family transcriptional regulator n=1 Tax=Yoonia rhodophyticola TaxID=3137370 RepID=A0AAN0MD38_9RHOB
MEQRSIGQFFDTATPRPVELDRSVGVQIFEALKLAILRMEIAPGALISETEVGRLFAASRTPVREALAQLRAAGLVVTQVGRGNFATKLSQQRIKEAQFIREALELGNVAALCQNGLDPTHRAALQHNLETQKNCMTAGDKLGFQAVDDQFHMILAQATGHPRMAHILEREKMALDRLRVLSLDVADQMGQLHAEHLAIFQAIDAGEDASARRRMETHLRSVLTTLADVADRHEEYFA